MDNVIVSAAGSVAKISIFDSDGIEVHIDPVIVEKSVHVGILYFCIFRAQRTYGIGVREYTFLVEYCLI